MNYSTNDYRKLRGQERIRATQEYRRHRTGPRARFEAQAKADWEFKRMLGIVPGGEGTLADLIPIFDAITLESACA